MIRLRYCTFELSNIFADSYSMRRIGNIWYGLSLRKKLIVYFSVLIVIALGIVFYSFRTTYFYIERFQTTLEEHFRLNAFLKELQSHGTLLDDMSRYKTENAFRETAALLDTGTGREETLLAQIKKTAGDTKEALFEIRALENCLELYRRLISDIARETDKRSGDFFQKMNTVFRLRFYMEQYTANLQRIRLTESAAYYDTIERSIAFSRWMFFSVLSAVVLMCIRFAFLFSKYFSEPISKLAEFAERMASGDLSVPPVKSEYASGKEIATLITAFNTMSRNIKDMIDDLKMKSQLEKMLHAAALEKESALGALREAQLVSLQNQIKPHFLFNTLNTIGRQAQEEHAEQTAKLILFLSHLMRYNLLSHRQSVPLIDELHALEDYIHLQQKRFGSRIRFSLNYPEICDSVQIPPFTVLTFAENSVRHGLESRIDGGTLYVHVRCRSGFCRIRIADTGSGMTPETLYSLRHISETPPHVDSDGKESGIGVRNIMTRLKLFYGTQYSFSCYSKKDRGTMTVIAVPLAPPKELREERNER